MSRLTPLRIHHIQIIMILVWLTVTSCKQPDDTKWQYTPDMADSPVPKAQMYPLDPPDGSVATTALIYSANEFDAEENFRDDYFKPPESREQFFQVRGEQLYATFCLHCHGPQGRGNGSMTDVFPRSPDLTDPIYVERKDGFFFHKITFGGLMMPSLGHAISDIERSMIIFHIRELQKAREKRDNPDQ
ncbi:MAG: cytochrome c [Proteobacteria bacterium]|nr:cytochrome c [Pseudomonadota bacterium]